MEEKKYDLITFTDKALCSLKKDGGTGVAIDKDFLKD